jgi:MFS family permease
MSDATASPARALDHPGFGRFWVAHWVSQFGDRVTELALPLVAVTLLSVSPGRMGLLTAAVWLPALLSLPVGSWADQRRRKRRVLVAADLARASILLVVPAAYLLDRLSFPLLVVVAVLSGLGSVFYNTSYPSFFVSLVTKGAYVDANSKLSVSRSASFVAGPAVGGVLVQVLTAPFALLVDSASFLVSALVVGRLEVADAPVEESADPWWRRAWSGVRFVAREPHLRAGLGCATTSNFFTFMVFALVILFANRDLGLPPGIIGLALGLGSLGGLLGAWVAPRLSARFGVGPMVAVGAVLFPAPMALTALAGGPVWLAALVVAAAEFLSGVGVMIFDINLNSVQTSVIPDGMRSRVSGAFATVNYGCRPLGAVLGGVLGEIIGIRPTIALAAAGGALGVLFLFLSPIPSVASVDDLAPATA